MSTHKLNYFALFFLACSAIAEPPPGCDEVATDKLVYTRQPRAAEQFANWQHWYDAGQPDRYTESDLVLDDLRGTITDIHNCTTGPEICAAHDGRVSPDGLRIAYTVARGTNLYPVPIWGTTQKTPAIEFRATAYEVWIYNTLTKTTTLVEKNARMPDWLSDNDLVFASSRAGTYAPWAVGGPEYQQPALQIYRAKLSSNALAEVAQLTSGAYAMNPAVLTTGEICYSEWDGYGQRGASHTPANQWWIRCMAGNGTNNRVVLGAHGSPTFKTRDYLTTDARLGGEGSAQLKLLRPVAEIHPGYLATPSYYRSNHVGAMGIIYGWPLTEAEGYSQSAHVAESVYKSTAEGSGRFVPDITVLTPYANDQDTTNYGTRIDTKGRAMGKAGYPAPSVDGEYIYTHCRGSCYEGTNPPYNTRAAMGGEPTAKFEIRKALVRQITDPFDLRQSVVIACADEQYNCRDARYVVPYQRLFGQPAPTPSPAMPVGKTTTLQIVNARAGEIYPISTNPQDKISFQGNAVDGWQSKIAAIRIDKITPWTAKPTRQGFAAVETVAVCPLEIDGSVLCQIPAGILYQTRGVDKDGAVVATDNTVHNSTGETVLCGGCHWLHSQEALTQFIQANGSLDAAWLKTVASKK